MRGLHDHPHREKWTPGGGGQCLHTVLPHPKDTARMIVAMSTGGAYRTEDGGKTWHASNKGVRAQFLPDKYPEFGQCVHKMVRHPARPERYFLQNHWGLYRSDDAGASWTDIANGVPSDFGFSMAIHPRDPDTVYIVPLTSDEFRCTPEAKLRVYRTRDAGASWKPLTRGLPQKDAFETVLRDALATDAVTGTDARTGAGHVAPAGVFFGTRSGKLFASAGGGGRLVQGGTAPHRLTPIERAPGLASPTADTLPVRSTGLDAWPSAFAPREASSLSVTVHLPGPLRPFNEGRPTAVVDAEATVGDALRALPAGVRDRILDERGALRVHVNVFVGETSVRETGGLATPVANGTEVFVIPAVSGGATRNQRPGDGGRKPVNLSRRRLRITS